MREKFEEWAKQKSLNTYKNDDGEYGSNFTYYAYEAYKQNYVEEKEVWLAYDKLDLKYVCELRATAERLTGKVVKSKAYLIDNVWYYPAQIVRGTIRDYAEEEKRRHIESLREKALSVLTEKELEMILNELPKM